LSALLRALFAIDRAVRDRLFDEAAAIGITIPKKDASISDLATAICGTLHATVGQVVVDYIFSNDQNDSDGLLRSRRVLQLLRANTTIPIAAVYDLTVEPMLKERLSGALWRQVDPLQYGGLSGS